MNLETFLQANPEAISQLDKILTTAATACAINNYPVRVVIELSPDGKVKFNVEGAEGKPWLDKVKLEELAEKSDEEVKTNQNDNVVQLFKKENKEDKNNA